ncbi:MAG: serine hydrolase [Clostridia bacterium]|nr:serine hydrolase [Clostridia bacterium]
MDHIQKIDALFDLWQQGLCPGGQVLVRHHGEVVYDRCFGYADVEKGIPMTHDHVFHVASISKQFTAMAILLLQEDGKLSLEDDIRKYIPDLVAFPQPMPMWTLMNQVSGLRDMLELMDDSGVRNVDTITQDDLRRLLASQTGLNYQPMERHTYCNSNYMLLAEIVERVSGMGFNAFLKQRIFDPLGMTSTVVRENYWQMIPNRGVSYWDNGTEYFHCVLNYGNYGTTSLHSNARDLMRWMDNYRKPTICKPETLQAMLRVPVLASGAPTNYAGGLRVDRLDGRRYLRHAGEDAGFRAFVFRLLDDDVDVVIVGNTANIYTEETAYNVARAVLGLPVEQKAPALPSMAAFDEKDAPGFYYSRLPDAFTFTVFEKDGNFYMTDDCGPAPLTHVEGDLYRQGHLRHFLRLGEHDPVLSTPEIDYRLQKAYEGPLTAEQLAGKAGRYESREVGTAYEVRQQGDKLLLWHFRRGLTPLYPVEDDLFVTTYTRPCFIRFVRDEKGAVCGLTLSGNRVQELPFAKQ